jgi:hypothetical protein
MNRTILIVICDFLLVSLLAFSTVDINKVADEGSQRNVQLDIATNQPADNGKDLAAVMRVALEEERRNRDQLLGELTRARSTAGDREQEIQKTQKALQEREEAARKLQQQQADLGQKYEAAQSQVQTLAQQLQGSTTDAALSREKLAAMEAEVRKQTEQAQALQKQLGQLASSNQVVLTEKQQLFTQLQVAEVEKRHATEQAVRMQEEVKVEREEKAKLADGVKVLASKSSELAQEMRDNRPLAPNTIFFDFMTNRVEARVYAARSGIFGLDSSKRKETEAVLVSDGTNTFALCHVEDTPFTLSSPGTEWEGLTGTLAGNIAQVPIRSLSFHLHDPRVVLMPVNAAEARQLGCRVYRVSPDPFKFQDAVLVGARDGYYGECSFQIDVTTPDYVKLDRSLLKGLFGKFNPSRGDLVFSKSGELLGIMVNATYCMMLRNFTPSASFQFGQDVRDQRTGETLARLYSVMLDMPFKLQ